jgi:hypothetical protein
VADAEKLGFCYMRDRACLRSSAVVAALKRTTQGLSFSAVCRDLVPAFPDPEADLFFDGKTLYAFLSEL